MCAHRVQPEAVFVAPGYGRKPGRPVDPIGFQVSRKSGVSRHKDGPGRLPAKTYKRASAADFFRLAEMADDDTDIGRQGSYCRPRVVDAGRIGQEKPGRKACRHVAADGAQSLLHLAGRGGGMLHHDMTSTEPTSQIAERRAGILAALEKAADHPVELIAVSKRQPDERIQAALDSGQRVFGENRVQEAQAHWAERRDIEGLKLHLIGPLQSKKSEDAVALFDVIQTIDRPKIVRTLTEAAHKLGKAPDLFIQVNTGEEPQKAGVTPAETGELVKQVRENYPGKLLGLMCIPPVDEPAGPHFALLARLAEENGLDALSMGMSADYELGAKYGATHVRVGSALFGERDAS